MGRPDTRTRILVTSLVLFNDNGEPGTTTNEIADETGISPGNLHYHFRRKADIVDALLAEFQADARNLLQPPSGDDSAVDEFWGFLHLLIEVLAAYRFLVRDTESLVAQYPRVRRTIKGFVTGLAAVFELHLEALCRNGILLIDDGDMPQLCHTLTLVSMFSERLDTIAGGAPSIDKSAARIASATIGILLPHAEPEAISPLKALLEQYRA